MTEASWKFGRFAEYCYLSFQFYETGSTSNHPLHIRAAF
jgi:hypothetical protein